MLLLLLLFLLQLLLLLLLLIYGRSKQIPCRPCQQQLQPLAASPQFPGDLYDMPRSAVLCRTEQSHHIKKQQSHVNSIWCKTLQLQKGLTKFSLSSLFHKFIFTKLEVSAFLNIFLRFSQDSFFLKIFWTCEIFLRFSEEIAKKFGLRRTTHIQGF